MAFRVEIAPQAFEDLDQITDYIKVGIPLTQPAAIRRAL